MPADLPNFLVIGAMKCATSSLQEQLGQQSGIFMSTPKEPNFFSDDDQFSKGLDWYRALFSQAPADCLRGEASTHYSKLPTYPQTIERIQAVLPKPKFIYIMRHPIDRLVSHYRHEWSRGMYSCVLEDAIMDYSELTEYGLYSRQLRPYFKAFGKSSICPVFFDHLIANPQVELERICDFIGYPGQPIWRTEIPPSNVSSERIRQFPLYAALIDNRFASRLRRALIPKRLRERVKSNLRPPARPEIEPATEAKLEQRFDADLAVLGNWLGIQLNCANFKDKTKQNPLDWIFVDGQ